MGQSAPVSPSAADASPPASLASADDLLAQLAGDEIDRLLADSDSTAPAENTPEQTAVPSISSLLVEHHLPDALDELLEPPAAIKAEAPAAAPAVQTETPPTAPPTMDVEPSPQTIRELLVDGDRKVDFIFDGPAPAYLRPLEWINAPFENLSDELRESIGKVAILTLVNALAVLLYVLIFRHPHH